ncbi:molybdopterin molybdotransferase MoeA [Baaleninema simplex]|uniref:molybdopterin molybdotransferase MoeA n=1 Tax=Baaleninema simplex TaxID=2862350 RepID=UPI00034A68BD|nr:gephyrin-like molybdotransferase Glp [Baaleninema simplex]
MLSVSDAERLIFDAVRPLHPERNTEVVNLLDATGRILAASVSSKLDFPHWDNSAMDGYAVRFDDVKACSDSEPTILDVIEEIPAGTPPQKTLQPGQTARILTGSMMPEGADTVVMQENTRREGDSVAVLVPPEKPGQFVRRCGSFYQAGNPLIEGGVRLQAADIAVLAAAQATKVRVFRKPRVAILSTGSELVSPEDHLQPGQIVDSNQYALASFLAALGMEPLRVGIVEDNPETLKYSIAEALNWGDVVVSTGGVSVGDYDYIDRILEQLGGDLLVRSVAIKPGKPLTFAQFPKQRALYFGLPGNPVSALVSCWRFVKPALLKLAGLHRGWEPVFVNAKTRVELRSGGGRETYLWGQLLATETGLEFEIPGGSFSSGNLINLMQTNGCARLPVGTKRVEIGETVSVLWVDTPVSHLG